MRSVFSCLALTMVLTGGAAARPQFNAITSAGEAAPGTTGTFVQFGARWSCNQPQIVSIGGPSITPDGANVGFWGQTSIPNEGMRPGNWVADSNFVVTKRMFCGDAAIPLPRQYQRFAVSVPSVMTSGGNIVASGRVDNTTLGTTVYAAVWTDGTQTSSAYTDGSLRLGTLQGSLAVWHRLFGGPYDIVESSAGTIVQTGDPAPGTNTVFLRAIASATTAAGQTLVSGALDPHLTGGLWVYSGGAGSLLVLQNTSAAGIPGFNYNAISAGRMGSSGHAVFSGSAYEAANPANEVQGMWAGPVGDVRLVVKVGDPAPGSSGPFLWLSDTPVINDAGVIAFRAWAWDGFGIWRASRNALGNYTLQRVVIDSPSHTLCNGFNGYFMGSEDPLINADGTIVFKATTYRTIGGVGVVNTSIWASRPSGLCIVVNGGADDRPETDTVALSNGDIVKINDVMISNASGRDDGTGCSVSNAGDDGVAYVAFWFANYAEGPEGISKAVIPGPQYIYCEDIVTAETDG